MAGHTAEEGYVTLSEDDIISNEPLRAQADGRILERDDRFQHRHVAKRVAQLIDAPGQNVNIAVNAPWGAGKSTFFRLLKEELRERKSPDDPKKPRYTVVDFDAWQMADETFESNFLVTVAKDIPGSPKNIEQRLFRANRTVNLPLGLDIPYRWLRVTLEILAVAIIAVALVGIPVLLAVGDPTLQAATADDWWGVFIGVYLSKLIAWLTAAAGGTLAVVVLGAAAKFWSVSVQESGPAHVAQFRKLFEDIMKRTKTTQVILVDELDRCAPDAVMRTLEGLRRFLGTERCIFVVAFDRESVSESVNGVLERSVPVREGRPYYSTAGEYLDKIFTYQVALPPQPRKAFRRYARDLIDDKGGTGVWGQLRRHGQDHLDTVVSILSPPHLTSPRRAKVILNDFAFNARLVESFNIPWVERADEIAVLTVLQTEFPLFYTDVEYNPNLLMHVAGRASQDPGETLQPLVARYRLGDAALDSFLTKNSKQTNKELNDQLGRFLEKLRDMRVQLPLADLIQLGTSGNMLRFEDPAVFATVEAASEVPREETLLALEPVGPADRFTAVDLILHDSEGERTAEAMTLRVIAGTLLPSLTDDERARLRPKALAAWVRLFEANAVASLPPAALHGFVSALAPTSDSPWVRSVLADSSGQELTQLAVDTLARLTPTPVFLDALDDLLTRSIDLALSDSGPLISVLRRMEQTDAPMPAQPTKQALFQAVTTSDPEDASVAAVRSLIDALVDFIAELPIASAVRGWLIGLFRSRAVAEESVDDYLRAIDTGPGDAEHQRAALDEVLLSLVVIPADLQPALVSRILPDVQPSQERIRMALEELLRILAADHTTDHADVRAAIFTLIAAARPEARLNADNVVKILDDAYRTAPGDDRSWHDILLEVARTLGTAPPLTAASQQLVATMVAEKVGRARDTEDLLYVLYGVQTESDGTLGRIVDDLRPLLPGTNGRRLWILRTILCAQIRLHELGTPVPAISADEIKPQLANAPDPVLVESWIRTIPTLADILDVLDGGPLSSISEDAWREYSRGAAREAVTELWRAGRKAGTRSETLRAIAAHGLTEDATEAAARELTSASNTTQRVAALRTFRTLPHSPETGAALVPRLVSWLRQGRFAETRLVTEVLVTYRGMFDDEALTALDELIAEWSKKMGKSLTRGSREDLRNAGYSSVSGR